MSNIDVKKILEEEEKIFKNISGWIKKRRTELGLTQTEFGYRIGFQKSRVSKWENGKENPSIEKIYKISEAIGIAPDIMTDYDCNEYELPLREHKQPPRMYVRMHDEITQYDVGLNAVFNAIHNTSELELFFDMAFSVNSIINHEGVNALIITADQFEGEIIEYSSFPIIDYRFNEENIEFDIYYTDIDIENTKVEEVENLSDKIFPRTVTLDIGSIAKIEPTYNDGGNGFYQIILELNEIFELGGRIIHIWFDISDSGDTLEYEDNQQL